jgi:hypothetical protein
MTSGSVRVVAGVACALLCAAGTIRAGVDEPAGGKKKVDEALRDELLRRVDEDQAARKELMEWYNKNGPGPVAVGKDLPPAITRMRKVDRDNTRRMKAIVDKHGWPGKSLVGEDGAFSAWLLVQHADHDFAFQKRCLPLLREAVRKGEAAPHNLAYLTDRVLVGEGKKQLYGTQLRTVRGKVVPTPIEDEAHVDQRRKEAGLEPLAQYLEQSQKVLAPARKGK